MRKHIYEIFEDVKNAKGNDKVTILQKNESWALKDVLRGTYDDVVQWNVPAGKPPFEENQGHNSPSSLLKQNRQFKHFVKGLEGDKMLKAKREMLYIKLLESIHPQDAEIVINMTSKTNISGITKATVKKAFPNLISQ